MVFLRKNNQKQYRNYLLNKSMVNSVGIKNTELFRTVKIDVSDCSRSCFSQKKKHYCYKEGTFSKFYSVFSIQLFFPSSVAFPTSF